MSYQRLVGRMQALEDRVARCCAKGLARDLSSNGETSPLVADL